MKIYFYTLLIIFGHVVNAEEKKAYSIFGIPISQVNVGVRPISMLEQRGVIFYRDFQLDPIFSVFLMDNRIEFLGNSIGYKDFIVDHRLRFRTRVSSISDKPLFPDYDSVKAGLPQRSDTYEWSNSIEIFLPGYDENYMSEIDLSYSKDISIHHGNYLNLQSKIKLFDFEYLQTKIEPNLYAAIGWGDSPHNQYFYGPSAASSGFNNFSYGLWLSFPKEADRFYPIILIKHFQTLGSFSNAEFAIGRNEGWVISLIASYGVIK